MLEKKLLLTIAAVVLSAAMHTQPARAQDGTPRVETGVHFSLIRSPRLDSTAPGVGGRITINLNDHVAVEGEINFFPRDLSGPVSLSGQQTQGLFGLKAGARSNRAGIFGKVRPGYVRFGQAPVPITCIAVFPQPFACWLADGRTAFALDLGGVAEFYPSRRTVVRFDLGDTIVNFRGDFGGRSLTTHNLQFNAGVGLRF
ncbi:MAG: outer membrane beta-barrel protein [Blastocatellia bacterium]